MIQLRTDVPKISRALAIVVRLVDAFTGLPIPVPMKVSIPTERWESLHVPRDGTYRFSKSNVSIVNDVPLLPTGVFDVAVEPIDPLAPRVYEALEPLQVTIPLRVPHRPLLPTDYRVDLKVWPTAAFRAPPGETALVGRLVSASQAAISGIRVFVFTGGAPPAGAAYARTDAKGQFLFRLPDVRRDIARTLTVPRVVQMRNPANTIITPTPSNITLDVGRVSIRTINIP